MLSLKLKANYFLKHCSSLKIEVCDSVRTADQAAISCNVFKKFNKFKPLFIFT